MTRKFGLALVVGPLLCLGSISSMLGAGHGPKTLAIDDSPSSSRAVARVAPLSRFRQPAFVSSFGFGQTRFQSHRPNSAPVFFNPPNYVLGGVYAFASAVADFNGDGKPDLVVTNQCPNNNCKVGGITILLGNGNGTFTIGQSYSSGGYEAYSVAIADLNGDGKKDIVIANGCQNNSDCTSGGVGVLLGNGDGTFQTAQSYSSGGIAASSVVIAKLNSDSKADLAVANQCYDSSCSSGGVSILLGQGDGTFQMGQSYPSGGVAALSVTAGDFNGDGKPDLAVANQCASATDCSATTGVLLGNGHGAFQSAVTYPSGGYKGASVATGDFNGDAHADLVVAAQCQSSTNCTVGNLGVLIGNGDGTFRSPKNYSSAGNTASSVSVAQLSSDGNADLVVSNQCQMVSNCAQGLVAVLLGKSDGTFQTAQTYVSDGVFAQSVVTADLNRDGQTDVAVVNQCQTGSSCSGTVTILLGNGNGTLQSPPTYSSSGYDADSVAIGDLNGDGKPDLVVADLCQAAGCKGSSNGGLVYVLLGNGDGTFRPAQAYPTGDFGTTAVAIADVNGDRIADVLAANQCSTTDCSSGGSVSVLLGNGDGTLQASQNYSSGAFTSLSVVVGDFNNDGKPDLAVASQCQDTSCVNGTVSVLLGNGNGNFKSAKVYPSAGFQTNFVAAGDFNQDGNLDLALASQCQDNTCQNGGVSVLLGNGDGTFQTAQSLDSGAWQTDGVAVADFNGDGIPDLAASNVCQSALNCSNGTLSVWLGRGDGTFRSVHTFTAGGQTAYSLVAADFNGDGATDVVVPNGDQTYLLLGNGDGTFQTPAPYYPAGIFAASGDVNGDKQPDVVLASGALSNVTVLLNIATGYRQSTLTSLTSNPNPSYVFQSVQFTATVSSQYGSPSGSVSFNQGSTVLGTAPLKNGKATFTYSFTSVANDLITALYNGNSNFLPSTSPVLKQKVLRANSTTSLTSSLNPSNQGQAVTFTATVTGQYGGTPTGNITFKDNGNFLAQVSLKNGVAQYKTSALTKGRHRIGASYNGDTNFHSSSASLVQQVN